jgi:hypothetical protein
MICAAADKGDPQELLDVIHAKSAEMNLVNLATAFHRLARLVMEQGYDWKKDDPQLGNLLWRTKQELRNIQGDGRKNPPHARCLSTIAWSCGRLRLSETEMMQEIGDLSVSRLEQFKPLELANLLWGFAKMQCEHEVLFRMASARIVNHIEDFTAVQLSVIAWTFATARYWPCCVLLRTAAVAFASQVEGNGGDGSCPDGLRRGHKAECSPVAIQNMVWALATKMVTLKEQGVLRCIANMAVRCLPSFKAHEIAITLWAFARLGALYDELFQRAAVLLCKSPALRDALHSQGVTNLLWAFAKFSHTVDHDGSPWPAQLQPEVQELFPLLLPVCERLLSDLKPRELSSFLWAVMTLAGRWGLNPSADHIVLSVCRRLSVEKEYVEAFSKCSIQGVSRTLTACTFFFFTTDVIPEPCNALYTRLLRLQESPGCPKERDDDSNGEEGEHSASLVCLAQSHASLPMRQGAGHVTVSDLFDLQTVGLAPSTALDHAAWAAPSTALDHAAWAAWLLPDGDASSVGELPSIDQPPGFEGPSSPMLVHPPGFEDASSGPMFVVPSSRLASSKFSSTRSAASCADSIDLPAYVVPTGLSSGDSSPTAIKGSSPTGTVEPLIFSAYLNMDHVNFEQAHDQLALGQEGALESSAFGAHYNYTEDWLGQYTQ